MHVNMDIHLLQQIKYILKHILYYLTKLCSNKTDSYFLVEKTTSQYHKCLVLKLISDIKLHIIIITFILSYKNPRESKLDLLKDIIDNMYSIISPLNQNNGPKSQPTLSRKKPEPQLAIITQTHMGNGHSSTLGISFPSIN